MINQNHLLSVSIAMNEVIGNHSNSLDTNQLKRETNK